MVEVWAPQVTPSAERSKVPLAPTAQNKPLPRLDSASPTPYKGFTTVKVPDSTLPPEVVTTMGPVKSPMPPMVQTIWVLLALVTVQVTPSMVTVTPAVVVGKLVPVMVMLVPGMAPAGLTPLTVGAPVVPPPPPLGF